MAIFKCKICGGALEIDNAQSVATCEYCGTKQTLPRLDDERRANLYDRANHFRRNNDFDKAMGIFEQILNEEPTDAEAYWSIVLCRYGIEYVEDPTTRRRVPTVNRAQFTSIFDDEDYKSAIANADGYQREIYEAEANAINELQKGILAISQAEEPFDVFICYKETDANGRRTQDSVLATELYHELTHEGFKVFFSRITLEDKLGQEYEPYIFAALNSARVMVVLGTKPEHFNAVWVKNEWSRYLALIKNGARKTLIPAYRDMDPYDLPEEFSHLQAQDMSKLGFMQDLTRGIKKIVEADAPRATVKETVVTATTATNIEPLLKRAFMFLEDGDFKSANEYCEKVLDKEPENAQAYLAKLMADLRVKQYQELADYDTPFDRNKNYQKAIRFADAAMAEELKGMVIDICERNEREDEEARKSTLYQQALNDLQTADIELLKSALKKFENLGDWRDAKEKIGICKNKIVQQETRNKKNRRITIAILFTCLIILPAIIAGIIRSYQRTDKYIYNLQLENGGYIITEYRGDESEITIPAQVSGIPVVAIGEEAFAYNQKLKKVVLSENIKKIDYGAFKCCSSLESITLSSSLECIGSYAFEDCKKLTKITIPEEVTKIGFYAFHNCTRLEFVKFEHVLGWYAGNILHTDYVYVGDPSQNAVHLTTSHVDLGWQR